MGKKIVITETENEFVQEVKKKVSDYFGITIEKLESHDRHWVYGIPRNLAIHLIRIHIILALPKR